MVDRSLNSKIGRPVRVFLVHQPLNSQLSTNFQSAADSSRRSHYHSSTPAQQSSPAGVVQQQNAAVPRPRQRCDSVHPLHFRWKRSSTAERSFDTREADRAELSPPSIFRHSPLPRSPEFLYAFSQNEKENHVAWLDALGSVFSIDGSALITGHLGLS